MANKSSNNVTVIDGTTNSTTTISTSSAGTQPCAIAINLVTNEIYVASYKSSNVTVIGGTPGAPMLLSPSNGARNEPRSIDLSWGASTFATAYEVQISLSSSFTTTIFDQSGATITSALVSNLSNGTTFYWRANASNANGISWSNVWSFMTSVTPVLPQNDAINSKGISFSKSGIIYNLPTALMVSIVLYDMQGRQVRQLVRGMQNAGLHTFDLKHTKESTGCYIVKFKAGSFIAQKKLGLIK